jgi:microcompartment protein CcmK/EutM
MLLAKVISRVVSTEKLQSLPNRQLLVVEALEGFGTSEHLIAIDSVGAGPGDTVLVLQEGTGARQATLSNPDQSLPAQVAIVGIVDTVNRVSDGNR